MKSNTIAIEQFRSRKEVAYHFGRSQRWVYDLEKSGCTFVGGRTKFSWVESFLVRNPPPSTIRNGARPKKSAIVRTLK